VGDQKELDVSLVIATPIHGAQTWSATVTVGYSESLRAILEEIPGTTTVVTYAYDTVRARNRIAATVLQEFPRATHVLWWDQDNWPENRGAVRAMMALGVDVVGVPYVGKSPRERWTHVDLPGATEDARGLRPVRSLGFGFTLTTTAALRHLSVFARKYRDMVSGSAQGVHRIADIFGQLYDETTPGEPEEDNVLLSEDYSFCKRWRSRAGVVYLYPRAGTIYHAGAHAFSATPR
jgi:hypothetical protein